MSVVTLPETVKAAAGEFGFRLVRAQQILPTISGVTQVTTFPDRRWMAQISINPRFGSDLREWSLFFTQMSTRNNVVAIGPPHYDGPSTGYSGSNPAVNGADQLGDSLDVDGLPTSESILLAGDFISFDTTSPAGNTNRQLIQVTNDVDSDGAGEATINLSVPIRQAPANDATVEIQSPTAFFMFANPEGGVNVVPPIYSAFTIDAFERIFP